MTNAARTEPTHRLDIRVESDVAMARQQCRALGLHQGLSQAAREALATAVSELGRNILVHAWTGEIVLAAVDDGARKGVLVIARDDGPGIVDLAQALQDGFSTSNGLGLGLPSVRRLMDEFELLSNPGQGTTVRMLKWASYGGRTWR
jgi:serine/threonine-protein kinase RsbT